MNIVRTQLSSHKSPSRSTVDKVFDQVNTGEYAHTVKLPFGSIWMYTNVLFSAYFHHFAVSRLSNEENYGRML